MGKPKTLPPTKAESAEERLEEIVNNKSALRYRLFLERDDSYSIYIMGGECRTYPDGFEALDAEEDAGILYVQRRNAAVYYDFKKDSEAQEKK